MNTKKHLLFLAALLSFSISLSSCSTTVTPPEGSVTIGDVANDIRLIDGKLYILLNGSNALKSYDPSTLIPSAARKLFIVNEGGFGKSNASIDVWNFTDSASSVGVKTFPSSTIQFATGSAPARIIKTGSDEAMVTFYYTKEVDVIDTKADTIKTRISVPGKTRGIAVLGGNAFITTDTVTNGVFIINTSTKVVTQVANISESPYDVIADSAHNAVILFGQGNFNTGVHPDIVWLDATTKTVLKKIDLGFDYYSSLFPAIKGGNDTMFICLGDRIVIVDLVSRTISNNSFIPKGYYGGIFDAKRNELILGDAKDFQNNGAVDIFDAATGIKKKSFPSGIIPGHFLIYQK